MKRLYLACSIFLVTVPAFAHERARVEALEKKVQQLEEQLSRLTSATAPAVAKTGSEERANQQRVKAQERMQKDTNVYTQEERREIETLYQVANKKWRSEEGKESLRKLIEKYDKANRTGCALLYLGQMSEGKEREDYLLQAIEGFSDFFYGNGVQVGAYACYYLAYYCKDGGKDREAKELFEEIRTLYPDAIDHRGRLLAYKLDP